MLKIEVVHDFQDKKLSSWNELLQKTDNPLSFQQFEWVKCWWDNFSTNRMRLFIVLATKNNEIIGIAPLTCKGNAFSKVNTLKFIGSGCFDYFDFIIKKGEEGDFINSLISYLDNEFKHYELQLKNIFQTSATLKIINERKNNNGFNFSVYPEIVVPYIELPETKQLFYLQTKRLLRVDVARRERRLNESGEVKFKYCENLKDAKETLEDFFHLHIKKWESAKGYSVYKFKIKREFLRNLVKRLFDKEILNIYYLSLGEKKLAICIGFKKNRRFIYYSTAYDPEFAKFSPGKLLVNKLINYLIENRYKEFDFGIGEEYYKTEWPYKIRQLSNIYIFPNKRSLLNILFKVRRHIISSFFLKVLPKLRKLHLVVYLWRFLNRSKGEYIRFQ